jgi:NADH-quinone oxidoreductase subunit H
MQNRMGPSYTGPIGLLQPIADYIKLLTKEDIIPAQATRLLFTVTPVLALSLFVFPFYYIPIDGLNIIPNSSFEGDLILVLVLITIAEFTMFLSGWSSTNPYSGIGATRVLTQFLGYDIPLIVFAIGPAFLSRSLSISTIATRQTVPFVALTPWTFILFLITLQAELGKDPFDIPHAETEIVAGYATEFSGRKLAFIEIAKDVQVVLGATLVTVLFLGGPYGPVLVGPSVIWYTFWFIVKVLAVIFLLEYVGSVAARLRIEQVVKANWRLMIPISLLALALTIVCEPLLSPLVG